MAKKKHKRVGVALSLSGHKFEDYELGSIVMNRRFDDYPPRRHEVTNINKDEQLLLIDPVGTLANAMWVRFENTQLLPF